MANSNISAATFDGTVWSGWSSKVNGQDGSPSLTSISEAVEKIKADPELGFRIIDADNGKIWVSEIAFAERAVKSAKGNFGIDVPLSNIFIGLPS